MHKWYDCYCLPIQNMVGILSCFNVFCTLDTALPPVPQKPHLVTAGVDIRPCNCCCMFGKYISFLVNLLSIVWSLDNET